MNKLIIVGLILLILAVAITISEFYAAKRFCNEENGSYSFSRITHYCNGEEISDFSDGWDYVKNHVDLGGVNISLP